MAVALTTGVFIIERKSGLLDRSLVAGMLLTITYNSHLITFNQPCAATNVKLQIVGVCALAQIIISHFYPINIYL